MAIWILAGFTVRSLNSGEILNGTSLAGLDLGGESRVGAAELIGQSDPQQVELEDGSRTITLRAPQAGLVVDDEASAEEARLAKVLSSGHVSPSERRFDTRFTPVRGTGESPSRIIIESRR